jgi:aminoglycoside phosphotransferase (APT) family kinase protein
MMLVPTAELLACLLRRVGLPPASMVYKLEGRGLDNEITMVELANGGRVVLRRWPKPRACEGPRARFLADHGVPAPALLAAEPDASLIEFVPGVLLGDLVDRGADTEETWRSVGAAFRRVHAVKFPPSLTGEVLPDHIRLIPADPGGVLHRQVDKVRPRLEKMLPAAVAYMPELHRLIDMAADELRVAPTALGHGDINLWNTIVGPEHTTLIDWDCARVCDPAMEVALLDKHTALFNGRGLPSAFFDGYGKGPVEPNTTLHRIVQTLAWAASSDWVCWGADPTLPAEFKQRIRGWHASLVRYLSEMPTHLTRLAALTSTGARRG